MNVIDVWSGRRAASLQKAMRLSNEAFAAHLGIATRTVANWHDKPCMEPMPVNQEALDTALSRASDEVQERFRLVMQSAEAESVPTAEVEPRLAPPVVGSMFLAIARESSTEAFLRATEIGSDAIQYLQEQAGRVARDYDVLTPVSTFGNAREVRDFALRLAEITRRPRDLVDLYVVVGQATALMGSIAFDLGHWDATAYLIRSAKTYADLAGHASLTAWTFGLHATLAFWCGKADTALDHVAAGLVAAPVGAPRSRLLHIGARAHAVRNDRAGVVAALQAAEVDRDLSRDLTDELHDDIGGEFRFDDARGAACAGAAWLKLGEGAQAERHVRRTLDAYAADSADLLHLSLLTGARIDMAAAHLLQNDLDGACAFLDPVFALDAGHRTATLVGRLIEIRVLLNAPRWSRDSATEPVRMAARAWIDDAPVRWPALSTS